MYLQQKAKQPMRKAIELYAAFIAGILAAGLLAYWYYVNQMDLS